MKKTYDRKVFKRKLLSDRRTVTVTIRLFMILLLGFPLLTRAGTVDSTRVANREVRGKVVDEKKLPIPGVSVRLGGTSMGTATDVDGKFKLLIPADTATLVVSFIGMKTEIVKIPRLKTGAEQKELTIVLREEDVKLEDVVVTGIFTRKKESFTGSASTYSAAELKTMGTQNVLQSLKTLDPAFAIIEDNQFGSDPNRLPNMEIRGKSSMLGLRDELDADPNQPLFILDGFESTLAAINDLDINRVASITILKDAASTAIYGSKAANGVIVVETVKPEAGKLQVSYNGNMNLSIPDLSSYNLMNSREKLEFELLAGRYDPANWSTANEVEMNRLYNEKLKEIESGVNTYWLAEPLRVGVNQKHSLYVQGGEGNFLFGLGAGYNGITGVMEKSDREVLSGNIDLIYRMSKFQFSNKFSLTSTDYKNPIVAFSAYAAANPYYRKYNEDGTVDKWLENNKFFKAANPLWNARQNSRDEGKNLSISNYFMAEYFPTVEWRVRARLGLTYGNDDTEKFYSRNDTRYENVETIKKGEYRSTNTRKNQVEAELSVTYAKMLGRHRINLVAGGNISSNKSLTQGYSALGFPEGNFSYPSFSNGYPENGTPTYYETVSRSVNGYFNAGYSFDDRYLMDFSLRTSGSSVFGTSRKYNTTWSVGLGWNLHKEKFIMDHVEWINILKLRASIGNPGNQSFDSAQSLLTYSFQYGSMNYFGLGAVLSQIGNPDLEWQITVDKNIGLDVTLFNKRFSLTADYYYKVTDPLLIKVSTPLSSGTPTYMTNAGEQVSQGLTASVSYYIFQDFEKRFSWMIRANVRTQKTRIDKIGNKLSTLNASGKGENTVRYYDGADPDDIWAVKSAGIDPSNGKELFYAKDGSYTYDFSYDDEVICGNTRPDVEGVIGTSLNWKGFSVSLNFRYQMGADVFNEALYSKVENISRSDLNKNQDKRALYERWQEVGDIVRFKDIASAETTPMSSRFVQTENVLTLESLYLGYEFYNGWIEKLGLSSLKLQFSMRDVFRASTIRSERGISYPFARSMEAGLSFNF
ncbi:MULTISPECIES: SusC/RagA family TonB-linked outer membrane protein [Butyricimonas]|uniref:SusC/RagA family TonB-linked outer membrane protein n=3 Tax=Butyricimonas TaxID=574697 RepID=A0A7X6BHG8_9BACT|nr:MULTISPECIES: SusC/RagA family TonB-linked outer membrane protein [Odoribacteraceae]NJC16815.1 TonB-linked SusC/RagA family outer membrane protein [Butyricimonas paravirosa]RGG45132.1 SusC/RagA family TonB-linked outer membrane protein [Odoribacter sp. AF21-41]RHH95482.1 SusC/RagA family TonB-linked outer membrane protein [Odoribacter sp. AM16-33]WOF14081.1 SusC/RagA family TonB-linked outer membrane protein [Butyricimonas paravirosa]GGJ52315.1 SusC/RagA family TonB-linked outer membrane pr